MFKARGKAGKASSSKNVGGAGPLNRAQRAIVRLTKDARKESEGGEDQETHAPMPGRKRGLSRKDLRKKERVAAKQQRHQFFKASAKPPTPAAQPATISAAAAAPPATKRKRAAADVSADERKPKRSKGDKGDKGDGARRSGGNFLALLQAQGLVKGGGPVDPSLAANDDDAEIAYYERLLKKSKPLSYDDGLDYVLDFMDELDENGRLREEAPDGSDDDNHDNDGLPTVIDDRAPSKPVKRHIPVGSASAGSKKAAGKRGSAVNDDDDDDDFDGDADLDVLLEDDDNDDDAWEDVDDNDNDNDDDDDNNNDDNDGSAGGAARGGSESFKSTMKLLDGFGGDDDDDDDDEDDGDEDMGGIDGFDDDENEHSQGDSAESSSEGEQNESDDDEDDKSDGAKDEGKTMYITRANAFGDNVPGGSRTGAYVPPALRATDSETLEAIRRKVKGVLNRLNASNLTALLPELEGGFSRHSRRDMSETLTSLVLDACVRKDRTLEHLLVVYAASIAALHQLVGMEVAAYFVQELATRLETHYERVASAMSAIDEEGTVDKECNNLVLMVGYLMHFQVIDATLGFDLARKFSVSLSALNVELLLTLLNCCGTRLRGTDPLALKDVLATIAQRVAAEGVAVKPRVRFMLEVITDLKHNRRKLVQDGTDEAATLLKVIRGVVTKRDMTWRDPLRVPLKDLLQSESRGRWWLVGSAWSGRAVDGAAADGDASASNGVADGDAAADTDAAELLDLARKQRMSTDLRKKIFVTIMGSADYLDAFEKLVKLKVKTKQDREIVHVVVDCCLQEKMYNPFYGHLLVKLCQHSQNHKVTLQFAFWDQLKKTEKLPLRVASHLARLMAFVVSKFALSLAILKVIEFDELSENSTLILRLFLIYLMTHYPEETTNNTFERIADNDQLHTLRTGLVMFFKHYVRDFAVGLGDGGAAAGSLSPEQKTALLQKRLKLAKAALMRGSGVAGIM